MELANVKSMTSKSNNQGRGYEFACINTLAQEIAKSRPVTVVRNSSYEAAENAWQTLTPQTQDIYLTSGKAAAEVIFKLEPRILEDGDDTLELLLQKDKKGKEGDVRDVLIIRRNISWEIGLSLKHNHFAVKHSRLSRDIDFGNLWYGIPCSQSYWDSVLPVFDYLEKCKSNDLSFNDLTNKEDDIYVPVLKAFLRELNMQALAHREIPAKLVEYLLGKYDFYKVISVDNEALTLIQTYNLHGSLNREGVSDGKKPSILVPKVDLPSRLVSLQFKPGSKNTLELYMDAGWQFSFRIHSAATRCEPSLKFDIQLVGKPAQIIEITKLWR